MKQKTNARQRREEENRRRKGVFSSGTVSPSPAESPAPAAPQPVFRPEVFPDQSPEEATREFLDFLDRYGTTASKNDLPQQSKRKTASSRGIPCINLEEGMPLVEEALGRMNMGLQEMRISHVQAVKLIHGYGSTGRGGKICSGVRNALAEMKRKRLINDYIPGEQFGPVDAASRKLVEQNGNVSRDPDYGRMNHGITIVVL